MAWQNLKVKNLIVCIASVDVSSLINTSKKATHKPENASKILSSSLQHASFWDSTAFIYNVWPADRYFPLQSHIFSWRSSASTKENFPMAETDFPKNTPNILPCHCPFLVLQSGSPWIRQQRDWTEAEASNVKNRDQNKDTFKYGELKRFNRTDLFEKLNVVFLKTSLALSRLPKSI